MGGQQHSDCGNTDQKSGPSARVRKFPCPYCKGQYSWVEPVLDDGSGPTYECGFCDEGMIVVGSEKHDEIKRNNPSKEELWARIDDLAYALVLLESVRDAARAVNDETKGDIPPSLGSLAKLADALHAEFVNSPITRREGVPNSEG
jgi:hypothetical protein